MAMLETDYPGRTPRRYVLSYRVEGVDRKIMFDPVAFWLGHMRLMARAEKRQAAKTWQEWQKDPENAVTFPFEDRLFYVPFEQRTYTRQRTTRGYKKADLDLRQESLASLEWVIQHELHGKQNGRKFKSAHLWNRGADDILYLRHPTLSPYVGTIETVAHVRADSSARNSEVPVHRMVTITDLFGKQGHLITNATSVAEGFAWEATKEGRTEIVVIDKHAAAVMELAKSNPAVFRNYDTRYGTAFLPFDFRTSFKHEGVSYREPEHFPGIAPDRNVLLMDILMYYLFHGQNGGTAFDMSKKLMQMNFLMDPSLIAGFREGRMHFEVVTHQHAKPEIETGKIDLLRKLYTDINHDLMRRGYALDGYTLEFAGSAYETVAFNYVGHGGESVRVLFHPTYAVPPVIVYKKSGGNGTEPLPHTCSPISLLAKIPHVSLDDWTRRKAETRIEIPNTFLPDDLKPDYKNAIARDYLGGIVQFRNNVTARYMYGTDAQKDIGRKMLWLVKD